MAGLCPQCDRRYRVRSRCADCGVQLVTSGAQVQKSNVTESESRADADTKGLALMKAFAVLPIRARIHLFGLLGTVMMVLPLLATPLVERPALIFVVRILMEAVVGYLSGAAFYYVVVFLRLGSDKEDENDAGWDVFLYLFPLIAMLGVFFDNHTHPLQAFRLEVFAVWLMFFVKITRKFWRKLMPGGGPPPFIGDG